MMDLSPCEVPKVPTIYRQGKPRLHTRMIIEVPLCSFIAFSDTLTTTSCKTTAIKMCSKLKSFTVGLHSFVHHGSIDVWSIQGSDRHVLILRSVNNLRLVDLMEELQRITSVPVQSQKLFFRGKELQHMKDRSLRDAGIDNNAQIRLIGDSNKPRYEAMISGNRPN